MSIPEKYAVAALIALLALGSVGMQVSAAAAESRSSATRDATVRAQEQAADRWAAAVSSARAEAGPVVEAARAAAGGAGDLATAESATRLDEALQGLDAALSGRAIGAIAARRDEVAAAIAAFRLATAGSAETLLAEHPAADQTAKDALGDAIAAARAETGRGVAEIGALRRAADRVVSSHRTNTAAAEAAAAAAATAAATGGADASGSGAPTPAVSFTPPIPPAELTVEARGDYWPGCPVLLEWEWWYPDPTGYVVVDPGYPYDIEVMEFEGYPFAVKSLPCILG